MQVADLNIKEFDLDKLRPYPQFVVVGQEDNEKITLVSNIIDHIQKNNTCDIFIFSHDSDHLLRMSYPGATITHNPRVLPKDNAIIIFDECYIDFNTGISELIARNKYHKITIFWLISPINLDSMAYSNADYIIMLKNLHSTFRKFVFDKINHISNFSFFDMIITTCTSDSAVIVDNQLKYYSSLANKLFTIKINSSVKINLDVLEMINGQINFLQEIKSEYEKMIIENTSLREKLCKIKNLCGTIID